MPPQKEQNGKKVLIVDDDEFLLGMYALKFQEAGFIVEVGKNGDEALLKAESFKPDVVLLDVVLPGADGFEVLRILRERQVILKIIMLTNLGQRDDRERSLALGAEDYIIKAHATPSEVVDRVVKLLHHS